MLKTICGTSYFRGILLSHHCYLSLLKQSHNASTQLHAGTPLTPVTPSPNYSNEDEVGWALVEVPDRVPAELDIDEPYIKLQRPDRLPQAPIRPGRVFDSSDSSSSPRDGHDSSRAPRGPRAMTLRADDQLRRQHSNGHATSRYALESTPEYFTHGICYTPKPDASDIYRTVIINNLPPNIRLSQILDLAKEHLIFSSQLLNTSTFRIRKSSGEPQDSGTEVLGTVAVKMEFYFQSSAEQFVYDLTSKEAINFTGLVPRVTHLTSSPTYPIPPFLQKSGLDLPKSRRIHFYQPLIAAQFFLDALEGSSHGFREKGWISRPAKRLEGGNLEIEFGSIRTAVYAFEMLRGGLFQDCAPRFVRDFGRDEGEEDDGVGAAGETASESTGEELVGAIAKGPVVEEHVIEDIKVQEISGESDTPSSSQQSVMNSSTPEPKDPELPALGLGSLRGYRYMQDVTPELEY